jgi:hypothetical protein
LDHAFAEESLKTPKKNKSRCSGFPQPRQRDLFVRGGTRSGLHTFLVGAICLCGRIPIRGQGALVFQMEESIVRGLRVAPSEMKPLIAKRNQSRPVLKTVESDEDLLRLVEAKPGAGGLVDIYAINSAVKVLRTEGKLPFDSGYILKGN